MTRPSVANTLLFWLMLCLGLGALAPCLALPAWLERQAQVECLRARERYLAGLQRRLEAVRKQIEHLNDDPAYILRLAEEDFGRAIKVLDVETIWIDTSSADASVSPEPPPAMSAEEADQLWPELDTFIDATMQRYPQAHLFIDGRTRPWIMGTGGGLIVLAIVLLGFSDQRRSPEPAPAAEGCKMKDERDDER
jgi:cell division protein FtsB